MSTTRIGRRRGIVALALLLAWGLAPQVRAADDDSKLREQVLALNDITGSDPIRGKLKELIGNTSSTKKLLSVATRMSKEKDQPFNFNSAYILASAAYFLKDYDASERFYKLCLEQALKLQSGQKIAQAYNGLINLYYETKKFAESEKLCKQFLELDDESVGSQKVTIFVKMLRIMAREGKLDEANKLLDTRLKRRPDSWFLLKLKGQLQHEAGENEDAAKTYEQVLSLLEKDEDLDKEKEAKAEQVHEVRYLLSGVYVDLNKVEKAAEQLKALLKDEPDNPTYNNDLGYIWADHDLNLAESEKLIRKALKEDKKQRREDNPDLQPDEDKENGAYLDSLGWVLYKQKKYKEAKKYLLEAVADKDNQHTEIYDHLGDIHMALGEKAEAVAAWKKAVEVAGPTKREQQKKAEVEKKLSAQK